VITAEAPDYLPGGFGRLEPDAPDQVLEIADNRSVVDIKVRLWRSAVVSGAVHDSDDAPRRRVPVSLVRFAHDSGRPVVQIAAKTSTDDNGTFTFTGLRPGRYAVMASTRVTSFPATFVERFRTLTTPDAELTRVVVDVGGAPDQFAIRGGGFYQQYAAGLSERYVVARMGERRLAFEATVYPSPLSPATAFDVAAGARVAGLALSIGEGGGESVGGRVVGPDGPLVGVIVRLTPADWAAIGCGKDCDVARAVTAADGSFAWSVIPRGEYVVEAIKVGLSSQNTGSRRPRAVVTADGSSVLLRAGADPSAGEDQMLWARAPVVVGAGPVKLDLQARHGLQVSGEVRFSGTSEVPTPDVVQRMTVTLVPVDAGTALRPRPAQVDRNLRLRQGGLLPGRYVIAVSAPNDRWRPHGIMVDGHNVIDDVLNLDANATAMTVVFRDLPSSVAGVVVDKGAQIARATVGMFPADYRGWLGRGASSRLGRIMIADATGRFQFSWVPPGEYVLIALEEGRRIVLSDEAELARAAADGRRVSVREGDARVETLALSRRK
jgi:protocatechuate 3,4-dioxygenase beta subunit